MQVKQFIVICIEKWNLRSPRRVGILAFVVISVLLHAASFTQTWFGFQVVFGGKSPSWVLAVFSLVIQAVIGLSFFLWVRNLILRQARRSLLHAVPLIFSLTLSIGMSYLWWFNGLEADNPAYEQLLAGTAIFPFLLASLLDVGSLTFQGAILHFAKYAPTKPAPIHSFIKALEENALHADTAFDTARIMNFASSPGSKIYELMSSYLTWDSRYWVIPLEQNGSSHHLQIQKVLDLLGYEPWLHDQSFQKRWKARVCRPSVFAQVHRVRIYKVSPGLRTALAKLEFGQLSGIGSNPVVPRVRRFSRAEVAAGMAAADGNRNGD